MGDGGRGVDLELVSRMVASHLRDRGVDASARGREIRVAPGLKLRLRPDPPDPDDVTSMFWIDVDGLHLEPPMRLDVSAWGLSADAQVMDAVHGILDSILPPVRWLAAEPWLPASDEAGHVLELEGAARRGWTVVAGDPWIVVALMDADGDPDALVPPLRAAIAGTALATLDPLRSLFDRLLDLPGGHWIKIYAGRYGDELHGRIDIDNDMSIEGKPFAASLPWLDLDGIQLMRQLIVMRPDRELPRTRRRRIGLPLRRG